MKSASLPIRAAGAGISLFFAFCALVYFAYAIPNRLFTLPQFLTVAGVFLLSARAVTCPFSLAATRAKTHPDTDALYYFDGFGRYLYAVGVTAGRDAKKLASLVLLLPGAGCICGAYKALTMQQPVCGMMLLICGAGLAGCGRVFRRIWLKRIPVRIGQKGSRGGL